MNKQKLLDTFLKSVLVLDTESTGLDPKEVEICEIGNTQIKDNTPAKADILFGTKEPIPFAASSKNNISRDMLKGKPTIGDNLEAAFTILELDSDTIKYNVAHNYLYDKIILESTFKREGAEEFSELLNSRKWICTFRLAQHLFKPTTTDNWSYQLNYLRYAFDLKVGDMVCHRAGDDCYITFKLLEYIANHVLDTLEEAGELDDKFDLGKYMYDLSSSPIIYDVFPWGKHQGTKLEDVPSDYYKWLLTKSDVLDETKDGYNADLAASIEKELQRRNF